MDAPENARNAVIEHEIYKKISGGGPQIRGSETGIKVCICMDSPGERSPSERMISNGESQALYNFAKLLYTLDFRYFV